jgi:hypothetical protein
MKPGDIIICRRNDGYFLTQGKEYTVIDYEEAGTDGINPFVWPAYVHVFDDLERRVMAHASRFIPKEPT